MGQCLITKLKSSVEDNSLEVFDSFTIHVVHTEESLANDGSQQKIVLTPISTDAQINVSVNNPGYFALTYEGLANVAQRKTSYIISGTTSSVELFFENLDYDITITGKYEYLKELKILSSGDSNLIFGFDLLQTKYSILEYLKAPGNLCTGDVSFLPDCLNFISLNRSSVYGDISFVNNIPLLTEAYLNYCHITGSLESIANAPCRSTLRYFTSSLMGEGSMTGDIATFSNFTSLKHLLINNNGVRLYGTLSSLGSLILLQTLNIRSLSQVSGSIEDFVESQLLNGRSSGTLSLDSRASGVTLNGNTTPTGTLYSIIYQSAISVLVMANDMEVASYYNGTWSY